MLTIILSPKYYVTVSYHLTSIGMTTIQPTASLTTSDLDELCVHYDSIMSKGKMSLPCTGGTVTGRYLVIISDNPWPSTEVKVITCKL